MSARDDVEALVRRARLGLEGMRLLQAAARGAIAGVAVALVVLLATKLVAAWASPPLLPWLLVAAGLVAGLAWAATRPSIAAADAALFLDGQLDTEERIVTLVTCPPGRFTDHVAAQVDRPRLPRLPLPREATLLPLALFALFAAGLLPERGAAQAAAPAPADPVATEVADAAGPGAGEAPDGVAPETVRKLARGEAPGAAESEQVRAAVEALHRPEERRAAADDLDRARGGDGAAAKRLATRLRATAGGLGANDAEPVPAADANAPDARGGLVQANAYPEAEAYLRAYRRALEEELK